MIQTFFIRDQKKKDGEHKSYLERGYTRVDLKIGEVTNAFFYTQPQFR